MRWTAVLVAALLVMMPTRAEDDDEGLGKRRREVGPVAGRIVKVWRKRSISTDSSSQTGRQQAMLRDVNYSVMVLKTGKRKTN